MRYEIPASVIKITSEELERQPKITDAVGWLMSNRETADAYSTSFDKVVSRFNGAWTGDYPDFCTNISNLKDILGERRLPTLKQIFNSCGKSISTTRYKTVLHGINQMMDIGDLRESDPDYFADLPYLTYQRDPSQEDVFVGSLFHFTEEWLILDDVYGLRNRRDLVVNALIETSALDRSNPLFEAVASPDELNWIQGNPDFSPGFQEFARFPQDASPTAQ